MSRTIISTMKKGITKMWYNENESWGFYFHLSTKSVYIAVVIAGIDIEFHVHNVRSIVYYSEEKVIT